MTEAEPIMVTNKQRKVMNNTFDELARNVAESVSRRQALRRFGAGFVGFVLAWMGLANKVEADPKPKFICDCSGSVAFYGCNPDLSPRKLNACLAFCGPHCA
jgi:hypothetical protein